MASVVACHAVVTVVPKPVASFPKATSAASKSQLFGPWRSKSECTKKFSRGPQVVCAVGDVSAAGTNYLIVGAVAVALIGTALPILFTRKDSCPVCDGAGFVRKTGSTLNANAARKDLDHIVCKKCNGLGKVGQVDKLAIAATKRKRM